MPAKWFKKAQRGANGSPLGPSYRAAVSCLPARSESLLGDLVQCVCVSASVICGNASSFSLLSHTALTRLTDRSALSPVDDPLILATVHVNTIIKTHQSFLRLHTAPLQVHLNLFNRSQWMGG